MSAIDALLNGILYHNVLRLCKNYFSTLSQIDVCNIACMLFDTLINSDSVGFLTERTRKWNINPNLVDEMYKIKIKVSKSNNLKQYLAVTKHKKLDNKLVKSFFECKPQIDKEMKVRQLHNSMMKIIENKDENSLNNEKESMIYFHQNMQLEDQTNQTIYETLNISPTNMLYSMSMQNMDNIKKLKIKYNKFDTSNSADYSNISNDFRSKQKKNKLINELPIHNYKEEIINSLKDNKVIIIVGETGCGKSTQIPQYIYEYFYKNSKTSKYGLIGISEPRKIAAISLTNRTREEMTTKFSISNLDIVSYTVRFDDQTTNNTIIKFMTDGILLRELVFDPTLKNYNFIMIDEVHERHINSDIVIGFIKLILEDRDDLKIVIASATMNSEKLSKFFNNAPVLNIPGKIYKVDIIYTDIYIDNYINEGVNKILNIHFNQPLGNILFFLPGRAEIELAQAMLLSMYGKEKQCQKCKDERIKELIIQPLYAALEQELQLQVFQQNESNVRKVIIATNIAEASVTIDNVRYVIDCGYTKIKMYCSSTGIDKLVTVPISKTNAIQRSGRAGRMCDGICYRLYTEDAYTKYMDDMPVPEIARSNLENVFLLIKYIYKGDIMLFPFIDAPSTELIYDSIEKLKSLECLDDNNNITDIGIQASKFPLSPTFAKMLLLSSEFDCSLEIIEIVSILQFEDLFLYPKHSLKEVEKIKAKFADNTSDHLTYLNIYKEFLSNNNSKQWCNNNFLNYYHLMDIGSIVKQVINIYKSLNYELKSAFSKTQIRFVLCYGLKNYIARKQKYESIYRTINDNFAVHIHPKSYLCNSQAASIVFTTLLMTKKPYIQHCTSFNEIWLENMLNELVNRKQ